MESFSGDTEGSTEDIPGRKQSKFKSLKNRLFGRSKRDGGAGAELSQSVSDMTAAKGPGSEEDLACPQGTMGSRALSADSIFQADQAPPETEPARDLSQENVHSKIKALQMKLEQQMMHLGPPPLVLPVRREDLGSRCEDAGLPHGHIETPAALSKTPSQPSSRPLSPIPKPLLSQPLTLSLPLSVPSSSSIVEPRLDFSCPAQFTPCLDTSAARHRLSVKPRNQRASTKKTHPAVKQQHADRLNNINPPESEREDKQQLSTQEALTSGTEQGVDVIPITSQLLPSQSPEVAPVTSEAAHKSSSQAVSQQDQALLDRMPVAPSQILRVKPHRPADARPSERPHSSFIQSELRDNRDGDFVETQATSLDTRNTLNKARTTEASCDRLYTNSGSSSDQQRVQSETESIRGIRRPAPGSGSFNFSITSAKSRDGERLQSGGFVGGLEHIEARHKAVWGVEDKPSSSTREKDEVRGGLFAVGRLRPEGAPHKGSVPSDRRDSLKKVEWVAPPSQNVTADTGATKAEEVGSNPEMAEEAVEARDFEDEEGKTAFGVKLRSTSLSVRLRSDSPSHHSSKLPACEEQRDAPKEQEIGDRGSKDPNPSGSSLQVKHNLLPTNTPPATATEVKTTSSNLKKVEPSTQGAQSAPQTAPCEVTWMSLAMEKTKSLQQLFTSRFPRDFPGVQTAAQPQAQPQKSTTPTEVSGQASTDGAEAAQTVRPSAGQLKTPPLQPSASREPQTFKGTSEAQFASQSASHPAGPTNPRTTQSPLHSSTQSETTTQTLAQLYLVSGQQQAPGRGLQTINQLKSTTLVSTTPSASGRGERDATAQEKEGPSLSGRRAVWAEKASFLEKRAEWTAPPGTKGMEVSGEPTASVRTKPPIKDMNPEGRQGIQLAESRAAKDPERPQEDKWLRKNVAPSSSPSLSQTIPSALQSETDGSRPSWMELAKRKSMAWSDKTMD